MEQTTGNDSKEMLQILERIAVALETLANTTVNLAGGDSAVLVRQV